jgi:hypothetical protein
MVSDLLPELTRESTDYLRRVTAAVDAEARRLAEQRRASHDLAQVGREASRIARGATRLALTLTVDIELFWKDALYRLDKGMEKGAAENLLDLAFYQLNGLLLLAEAARGLWEAAALLGATPDGVDELDAAARRVGEAKVAAERMRAFLATPRNAVDPAALAAALQAVKEGRFQAPDAVRAALPVRPA